MWKNFFILLFSITTVFSATHIEKGNEYYIKQDYLKAIDYYKKAHKLNDSKARLKLIMSYIKLGDNFYRIQNYQKAKSFYQKAKKLKSAIAKQKLSKVYEKEADLYYRIKDYKNALKLYKLSRTYGNSKVLNKIKKTKKNIAHEDALKDDTRELVSKASPKWTKAIGRLITPTSLEFKSKKSYTSKQKKCSATLVNFENYTNSKVIITASHCLTGYDKTAGDIRFIIKTKKGKMIQRYAKIYIDSDFDAKKLNKKSDYAILILHKSISKKDVTPMYIDKRSYLKLNNTYENSYASLAGFSSDVGEYGARLTYDPKCKLNYFNRFYGKSNCKGFKGASGGPVVITAKTKGNYKKYFFVGVASHFKNNQFKNIYFAPHHIFYSYIKKAIKANNT